LNDGQDIAGMLNPGEFGMSAEAATAALARMTGEYLKAPPPVADPGPKLEDRAKAAEARLKLEALRLILNGVVSTLPAKQPVAKRLTSSQKPSPPVGAVTLIWRCLVTTLTATLTAATAQRCAT